MIQMIMILKKHQLEVINILDSSGKLNENAQLHIGEDRFDVRKSISKELDDLDT